MLMDDQCQGPLAVIANDQCQGLLAVIANDLLGHSHCSQHQKELFKASG